MDSSLETTFRINNNEKKTIYLTYDYIILNCTLCYNTYSYTVIVIILSRTFISTKGIMHKIIAIKVKIQNKIQLFRISTNSLLFMLNE